MIDVHVHLLPGRLAVAVREFFERHITDEFAYPFEMSTVMDGHAALGVEAVWNLPYAHKSGVAHGINVSMAELSQELSDHEVEVIHGATVHPDDPDPAEDLRVAVADLGARVVKLHCSVGEYAPTHPGLGPVYETAAELGVPVLIHVGVAVEGTTTPGDLEPFEAAARRHRDTTFLVAHTGSPSQDLVFSMMRDLPNVWADLTPNLHSPIGATAEQLTEFAYRIVLGSDAPNTVIPLRALIRWIDAMDLDTAHVTAILRENALRLVSPSG